MEWNQTVTPYPREQCIHTLFEAQVERTPDSVAIVFQDAQLTYGQLNRKANQLAHALQRLGVGPESLVGIYMDRSLEMIIAVLAILKAGGAYMPLESQPTGACAATSGSGSRIARRYLHGPLSGDDHRRAGDPQGGWRLYAPG